MTTRRNFLQLLGIGAGASLFAQSGLAENQAAGENKETDKPTQHELKLGLASYTLRQFPLEKCLEMADRVGLKHLCLKSFHLPLESSAEEITRTAEKIRAAGFELYGCGGMNMHKPSEVETAFQYAKAAGMRTIVCAPSFDMLPLINEHVQKYDIQAAVHNHGPEDRFFPTPESAYEKIKHFDRRVGLCIDIGHTLRAGADPALSAERFADRLMDVHVKDVSSATAAGRCVEAGRGVIDLPRFLGTLLRIKYQGIVSFEYEKDPHDPLPGLAESVGYVRGVLAALRS